MRRSIRGNTTGQSPVVCRESEWMTRSFSISLILMALLVCSPQNLVAEEPVPDGYPAPGIAGIMDPSSVDPLNGVLRFSIPLYSAPISPGLNYSLRLSYSGVWTNSYDNPRNTAGLGFQLHMGRVFTKCGMWWMEYGECEWYYDDGSGVAHRLFLLDESGVDWWYTLDNSSIKATTDMDDDHLEGWILLMPDGTRHEFYQEADYEDLYYLTRIVSPVPSTPPAEVTVEYDNPSLPRCITSIHDSHGREINITCSNQHPNGTASEGVILAVDVPAFGTQRAVYSFEYIKPTFYYPESTTAQQAHHLLTALQLNDSQHRIEFGYGSPITGNIRSIDLPTGGRIEYDYDLLEHNFSAFDFPPPIDNEVFINAVVERRVIAGSAVDTWQYERTRYDDAQIEYGGVVKTRVTDPFGNVTEYFFLSALAEGEGDPEPLQGALTRIDFYHGPVASANLKRSTEYQYAWDPAPNGTQLIAMKTRISDIETTYHDDGEKVSRTHFNGWDGHNWERREDFGFDEQSYRCYRTIYHDFEDAWIVSAPESVMVQEDGCQGVDDVVAWTEFEYEEDGRLQTKKEHLFTPANLFGISLQPKDSLVTGFTYDPSTGNLASVSKSSTVPNTPGFELDYTFEEGYQASEQFVGVAWKSMDADIDESTGLSVHRRNSAGYQTSYGYDSFGRVTSITPPAPELPWSISYPSPNETISQRGTSGTSSFQYERKVFDDLGRLASVERLTETGALVHQVRSYLGSTALLAFESQWAPSSQQEPPGTTYLYTFLTNEDPEPVVDPFGRVQKVIAADGKITTFSYQGTGRTTTNTEINNTSQEASTSQIGDAFGRVVEIIPPSVGVRAEYTFDVLDHLRTVELTDQANPNTPAQLRTWEYDTLGRVVSMTEPEKGTTEYPAFDASGRPLQVVLEDGRTHRFTYDVAGRATREETKRDFPSSEWKLLKETLYQNSLLGTHGAGALSNVITLTSYDEASQGPVETRDFYYDGLNGRVDKETQRFPFWLDGSGQQAVVETKYLYHNDTGLLSQLTYPSVVGSSRLPTKVSYAYSHGFLTSMNSNRGSTDPVNMLPLVTSVAYNSSGTPTSINLSNGVQEILDRDVLSRPSRIRFKKGTSTLWDSGTFQYDGVSNVVAVGTDTYAYDQIGRLLSSSISSPANPATFYSQAYGYDAFGNMKNRTNAGGQSGTQQFQVNSATNRLGAIDLPGVSLPYVHNSNGSVTSDGLFTYTYDNAERLKSLQTFEPTPQTIETYEYDASNYRISIASGDLARRSVFLRAAEGKVLSEYSRPSSVIEPQWKKDYVYALGRHIAVVENIEPNTPTGVITSASAFESSCGFETQCAKLSWQTVSGADVFGYDVYRAPASPPNSNYSRITSSPVQGTSYTDTGVAAFAAYYYKIVTVDTAGVESASTSPRKIKTSDSSLPTTPGDLYGGAVTCSLVSLTWSASTDADNFVVGYNIYRRVVGTPTWPPTPRNGSVPIDTTSFSDSLAPLVGGGPFEYKLEALDAAGWKSDPAITTVEMPPIEECGGGGAHLSLPTPDLECSDYRTIGQSPPPDTSFRLRFVHIDHLGTPRLLTSQSGTSVASMKLFPFGDEVPGSNWSAIGHRFTGHERDASALQDYMLARSYQYNSARFSQSDPILSAMPLDPQTWNKYSYARNNPIAYTDPTGTSFIGKLLSGELFGEGHVGEGVEFNLIPEIPIFPSIGFHGFDGVADQGRDFDDLVKRGRIYAAATPSGQCAPNDNSCEHIRITPGPVPHAPSGASVGRNVKRASKHNFIWWYFKVRNKGNWDYKQFGPHREFEDFGNFNFGATGRAVGIPRVVLRAGAGVAGWIAGTATSGPYMDDSKDQYWIEAGMNFYDYGGYNPCNPMTCSGY